MPERPAKDPQRPRSMAAQISDEADVQLLTRPAIDHGAPLLTAQTIPHLQQMLGNRLVSRLLAPASIVQLGRGKGGASKAKTKQQQKKEANTLNRAPYASWNEFYTETQAYLNTGGKERIAWLKKAEVMGMAPPPRLKGAHSSTKPGEFDQHVLAPIDLYKDERIEPKWSALTKEQRAAYLDDVALLNR
jgi:hypothetical protein